MSSNRVFPSKNFIQPIDSGDPIRSVVKESSHAVIVAWIVKPGQRIKSHIHPQGQDTWTILSGSGDYSLNMTGATQTLKSGDIVVAEANEVHGVGNKGNEPLIFVSVVSPPDAGYELLET